MVKLLKGFKSGVAKARSVCDNGEVIKAGDRFITYRGSDGGENYIVKMCVKHGLSDMKYVKKERIRDEKIRKYEILLDKLNRM